MEKEEWRQRREVEERIRIWLAAARRIAENIWVTYLR